MLGQPFPRPEWLEGRRMSEVRVDEHMCLIGENLGAVALSHGRAETVVRQKERLAPQ